MYSINKHCFREFKIAPGHRANYAILCNPEFKEKQWGMKYSPANDYSREYKILPLFSHPQIPVRYEEGKGVMYKDGQSVLIQNYLIMTQRYTHHCPESLREGIEVLEKVDYNLTTLRENRNVLNA